MNLRGRDLVAALCAIVLTRMAWTENYMSESISASLRLAFYTPWIGFTRLGEGKGSGMIAPPVPIDVDGDGTVEAICVITKDNTTSTSKKWVVEIIDLKPLHRQATSPNNAPQTPFRPKVLFQSEPVGSEKDDEEMIYPVKMTSGQVMIKPRHRSKYLDSYIKIKKKEEEEHQKSQSNTDDTDRTRHYFCGVDWHDAANNCHQHCPKGTQSECPDGMQCYADTPCDSQASHASDREEKFALDTKSNRFNLELTPGGGLPSVFTLWSDGSMSLHSITADLPKVDDEYSRHQKHHHKLQLRQIWKTPILKHVQDKGKRFEEVDILFLGSEDVMSVLSTSDKNKDLGLYGMIVVGGSYKLQPPNGGRPHTSPLVPFTQALDAMTGESLWGDDDDEPDESNAIDGTSDSSSKEWLSPIVRGHTSTARRRSLLPQIAHMQSSGDTEGDDLTLGRSSTKGLPDCMMGYRHSLLDPATQALPYAYFSMSDTKLMATHIDRRKQSRHRNNNMKRVQNKVVATNKKASGAKKWHASLTGKQKKIHQHEKYHTLNASSSSLKYGRPNVLLNHYYGGMKILSLTNGRPICHVSLLGEVLYADLNGDGILDHVQVVTDDNKDIVNPRTGTYKDRWVANLANRVTKENEEVNSDSGMAQRAESYTTRLCHVLALSGMPAREELFSANLCPTYGPNKRGSDHHPSSKYLSAAPPLVVEHMAGDGQTKFGNDVVIALNNGVISRFHSLTGKRRWQVHNHDALPTWAPDADTTPYLSRIDFIKAMYVPSIRPILVTGDDGMALLSTGQGHILATTKFPQTSIGRPIIADLSGDGTSDILIISKDAIWGYHIVVRTGGSIMFRIMVGLLLVGVAVALLRNRFSGQRRGVDKRSTDE